MKLVQTYHPRVQSSMRKYNMRLLLESYLGCRIFQDRSPAGIPRFIVETPNSTRVYSSLYYNLTKIREFLDNEYL